MDQKKYSFKYISNCNMCSADVSRHKVLGKRLDKSQGKNPNKKTGVTTTVCRCRKCGLIFCNPLPMPENIQSHYDIKPEEYWEDSYINQNDESYMGMIKQFDKLVGIKSGMRALDIGAGFGKHMIAMEKSGFDTYGIEASESFYERAISQNNINKEKLKLAKIEDVEFPENYFDFIFFGAVLEHLYDPSAAITNSLIWLKPKGVIYVQVPSSKWLVGKLINLFYKIRCINYVGNLSPMHEPFHLFEFSLKTFQQHAIKNNYSIIHHEYAVCKTYMPKYSDFILKPLMKRTNTGMELYIWLQKN